MAATYTQNITPFEGRYNATTMVYTFTGSFTVQDALAGQAGINNALNHRGVGDWSTGDWTLPAIVALPLIRTVFHYGTNVFGHNFFQTVTCHPTGRTILNTTSDNTLDLMLTFEGRVHGTHDISPRVQMTSDILFQSLRPSADGTYAGLGMDFAGAPRDVPMEVYSVSKVIWLESLNSLIGWANVIAGSVNEHNWEPPWDDLTVTPGVGIAEGEYLYLGPTSTVIDRNSRTAVVTHEFARLQSMNKQHIFRWFEFTETYNKVTGLKERKYDSSDSAGFLQKVAGTDKWWDGTTNIPGFWTLVLGNILF